MTPAHALKQSFDEGSSSGTSFVHSMNQLSTAKDGDSRETSDLSVSLQGSKQEETSEDSESDHSDIAKMSPDEDGPQSSSSKETGAQSNVLRTAQHDFLLSNEKEVTAVASQAAVGAWSSQSVGRASSYADLENMAKQMSAADNQSRLARDEDAHDTDSPRLPNNTARNGSDTLSARQHSGTSCDHAVGHTVDSFNSMQSSASIKAPLPPTPAIPTAVQGKRGASHASTPGKTCPSDMDSHLNILSDFRHGMVTSVAGHPPLPASTTSMASMQMFCQTGSVRSKPPATLRRGKWTVEEETYVARVIQDFNSGYLNAPAGTTLRSYLSDKLQCDPMRITKKFTGDACIGKRVFHPAVRCPSNSAAIDKAHAELDALERRWRRRLEMQQRESAKKAAVSAAAAVAAASGRSHLPTQVQHASVGPSGLVPTQAMPTNPSCLQVNQTAVSTASWLDRASAILSSNDNAGRQDVAPLSAPFTVSSGQSHAVSGVSQHAIAIEDQMKEVQRLIHEGPIIQLTTAGLPHLLEQQVANPRMPGTGHRKVTDESPGSVHPPLDKRPRTSLDRQTSGAEGAEALVGFLNSVRASAEASESTYSVP